MSKGQKRGVFSKFLFFSKKALLAQAQKIVTPKTKLKSILLISKISEVRGRKKIGTRKKRRKKEEEIILERLRFIFSGMALADPRGVEPLTFRMPCGRSSQLSYGPE